MRLFWLEIKRVLKSRRTMVLLAVAIVLSLLMAVVPVSFDSINRPNADGSVTELNGYEAIKYKKNYYTTTYGEVTPEKVADALRSYQACIMEYGGAEDNVPLDVYIERLLPIKPMLRGLVEAYAAPQTLIAADLMEIDPNDVEKTYYEKCYSHLKDIMQVEQEKHPAAQEKASELYEKVDTFVLNAGLSRDTFDYIELYIMLMAILCIAMTAPLFSGEYQTGADSILRCTKHGRSKLAITKMVASLTIFAITYALCIAVQLLIINFAFGYDCLKTSIQMLYSIINLPNINMGQTEIILAAGGLLSVLACIGCTMFISAKCKDSLSSMLIAIIILFIPLFAYQVFDATWISSILPSAGIGLQNNLLYQLIDFNYLHIGNMSFWTPYVILISAAVEIPVFLILAVRSYCKHQVA